MNILFSLAAYFPVFPENTCNCSVWWSLRRVRLNMRYGILFEEDNIICSLIRLVLFILKFKSCQSFTAKSVAHLKRDFQVWQLIFCNLSTSLSSFLLSFMLSILCYVLHWFFLQLGQSLLKTKDFTLLGFVSSQISSFFTQQDVNTFSYRTGAWQLITYAELLFGIKRQLE